MALSPARQRQAACACGSRRSLAACCLPWEEAFQRLYARLVSFAGTPRIRRHEAAAAAIFWNTQRPLRPGKGQSAAESLRFLEWFLHDHPAGRGGAPLLAEFADAAAGLGPHESALLCASLLAPVRAYEVTEIPGPRQLVVKDLLTGGERRIGPLGLDDPPIRSDVLICRLLPLGRLIRPGASLLVLPAAGREEMLAYLRTAYRMARPARHVSLEDFLDGATHLYHHFFLLRGRDLGGRAGETLRLVPFAPGRVVYEGAEVARIRAGLDRQPELEREGGAGEEVRYAWIDPGRALTRATVLLGSGRVEVSADTHQDLAAAQAFLETCLRGLIQPAREAEPAAGPAPADVPPRHGTRAPGTAFFARLLERWPDTPCPQLDDRTPREASRSRAGRERVAALLHDLERDFLRLRRLGRASADLTSIRALLHLPTGPPAPGRRAG